MWTEFVIGCAAEANVHGSANDDAVQQFQLLTGRGSVVGDRHKGDAPRRQSLSYTWFLTGSRISQYVLST